MTFVLAITRQPLPEGFGYVVLGGLFLGAVLGAWIMAAIRWLRR